MPRSAKSTLIFLLGLSAAACQEVGARRDIQDGNKRYYDGKYDDAIALYTQALKVDPKLDVGWFNLGLAHLALFAPGLKTPDNERHATGAMDALEHYIALMPQDAQARDYLISTYIDSGHYEKAIAWFEREFEKDPKSIVIVSQLAQISQQAGNYDAAVKWNKKKGEMVKTDDEKADAWYSIGVLDWRRLYNHIDVTGADRIRIADEGIGWLQKADAIRKNHSPTIAYLNLLYRERGNSTEVSYARLVDSATAQIYHKQALDILKQQKK